VGLRVPAQACDEPVPRDAQLAAGAAFLQHWTVLLHMLRATAPGEEACLAARFSARRRREHEFGLLLRDASLGRATLRQAQHLPPLQQAFALALRHSALGGAVLRQAAAMRGCVAAAGRAFGRADSAGAAELGDGVQAGQFALGRRGMVTPSALLRQIARSARSAAADPAAAHYLR
jgi:hypothetical protein